MFNEYLEGISKPQETFSITFFFLFFSFFFSFSILNNEIQLR